MHHTTFLQPDLSVPTTKPMELTSLIADEESFLADRAKRCGVFVNHARITQNLKAVVSDHLKLVDKKLNADMQESLDMICHKIGRIINGDENYEDHWVDIACYAKLIVNRLQQGSI